MMVKNTKNYLLFSLIFSWAILCFKPALATECKNGTCTVDTNDFNGYTFGEDLSNSSLIVNDGGVAKTITINNGGDATINAGGEGVDFTINQGGQATINAGGEGEDFSVNSGASLTVAGNLTAQAQDITAYQSFNNINGGNLYITSNGTAEYINLNGGYINIADEGSAEYVVASEGVSTIAVGDDKAEDGDTSARLTNVEVLSGATLKLMDQDDGGDIDNVTVSGMLVSDFDENNPTHFTATQVTINDNGSFSLSTNDNIGSLVIKDDNQTVNALITNNSVNDLLIKNKSSFEVKSGGKASNTTVKDNGSLTVLGGGEASGVSLSGNAYFETEAGATVTNLSALGNSSVKIADNTLAGDLTIGKDVNLNGLNVSNLFGELSEVSNLTLTGGQNSAIGDSLKSTDTTNPHNLTLENGNYSADLTGWDDVTLKNVKFTAKNQIEAENVSIDRDSTIYISNPFAIKSSGAAVENAGIIDFVTNGEGSTSNNLTIVGNYVGLSGSLLKLNIDFATETSNKIIINGTASGTTDVLLTPTADGTTRNDILFAEAYNVSGGSDVFNIKRVSGSYYEWDTVFNNNKWYARLNSATQDGKHIIVPEVAAYYGLIDNTFMQTSSLGANLRNNIAISEYAKIPCRNVKRKDLSICRSARPVFSGWLAPVTSSATVESPFVYDAQISGFDGGLDLLSNGPTKIGLLASYRQGSYNYEENGDEYIINKSAETNITSYLAGAYIRYDGPFWSTILAGYAGMLDADIETEDDIRTSTSGTTYGVTLDVNYIYKNINGIRIEPGVRVSYTTVEMDPVEDNGGKTQEFDNASRTEIEAGIRFAKRWEFPNSRAEIFIKPSVVQIMDDGEDFALDKNNTLAAAEDRTLLKVSAGMSFDMTSSISASLAGSYLTGDDYEETSGNLSVMYKF